MWRIAAVTSPTERVSPLFLVYTYVLLTLGELCLSPVGLSSMTKLSPRRYVGQMMGSWFLAAALGNLTHKRTRPYRPQTNGKVERFNRTLLEEWAYERTYGSSAERAAALGPFLERYNFKRPHGSLGKQAPATRVKNLVGNYS